ncbi:hypothetical protein [Streptomyces sp. NBC_00483]|uniref:hypothetical protein n=1 Tax=Streptomyces sp. NBC_00483 TaxID=2975756 RepID=UPI002E16F003
MTVPRPGPATHTPVWQPYEEEPLLTAAMTGGPDTTPPQDLRRLRQYLEAVAAEREGPLHTAVAFNAAYFGYETGGERYGRIPLDPDTFPELRLRGESPPLPVGALVRIDTGDCNTLLYAEIVYREGRHPAAEEADDVPAWLSGAPAGATDPRLPAPEYRPGAGGPAVRRELLVPDLTLFGLQPTDAKLSALCRQDKWLNRHGHLLTDIRYASADEAARSDRAAFVAYLLTCQREALLAAHVPVPLAVLAGSTDDGRLQQALEGILDVIEHALAGSEELLSWQSYALPRRRVAEGLGRDGALGRHDLATLAGSLERAVLPRPGHRRADTGPRSLYTAVAPWLTSIRDAGELLDGPEYAVTVCRVNLAMSQHLGSAKGGLLEESDVRVSLDDAFESGGIWRSHHPGSDEKDDDPLTPAGRGWTESVPRPAEHSAPPTPAPEPEPLDDPLEDDTRLGGPQDLRIGDSEVTWRFPLRLKHLTEGTLPLRPLVREVLRTGCDENRIARVELHHPGGTLEPDEEVQETMLDTATEHGELSGISWPFDFFPGLFITVQWTRGARLFRLSTSELDVPVEVDGELVSHAYDAHIHIRETGPAARRPSGAGLGDLVLRTVRRCGRLTPDGHALLDRSALPRTVYGDGATEHQSTSIQAELSRLLTEGRLFSAIGSRDADGVPWHPAREGEVVIPIVGYDPAPRAVPRSSVPRTGPVARSTVAVHHVSGFLRRLPAGWDPSDAQRAAYRAHCRWIGKADGAELPPGFTFVTEHDRRG